MGDARVKEEALQILGLFQVLPRLVVFDLDYTLWPFYCECRSKREMPRLYPHAKDIICALKDKGIAMAIASRSPTPDIAKTFLNKLEIQSVFVAQEIFSSWTHKTEHFQRIQRRTGVPLKSMLFFDDEDRNIEAVSNMGVTSILVGNGVNLGALRQGLTNFASNTASSNRSNRTVDTSVGGLYLPNSNICANRRDFVFWDAFYPTDAANAGIADRLFFDLQSHLKPTTLAPAPSPHTKPH